MKRFPFFNKQRSAVEVGVGTRPWEQETLPECKDGDSKSESSPEQKTAPVVGFDYLQLLLSANCETLSIVLHDQGLMSSGDEKITPELDFSERQLVLFIAHLQKALGEMHAGQSYLAHSQHACRLFSPPSGHKYRLSPFSREDEWIYPSCHGWRDTSPTLEGPVTYPLPDSLRDIFHEEDEDEDGDKN